MRRGRGEAGGEGASACPSDQRLSPLEPGKETGILLHKEAPGPVSGARLRPSLSHGTVDKTGKVLVAQPVSVEFLSPGFGCFLVSVCLMTFHGVEHAVDLMLLRI